MAPDLVEVVAGPWVWPTWRCCTACPISARSGTEGSEQVNLAEGLLADSETRVVYAQSPGEVSRTGELLGLTDTEAELVTQLRRGMALWKVGRRSFLVEHRLASGEQWLTDTDQAMNKDHADQAATDESATDGYIWDGSVMRQPATNHLTG